MALGLELRLIFKYIYFFTSKFMYLFMLANIYNLSDGSLDIFLHMISILKRIMSPPYFPDSRWLFNYSQQTAWVFGSVLNCHFLYFISYDLISWTCCMFEIVTYDFKAHSNRIYCRIILHRKLHRNFFYCIFHPETKGDAHFYTQLFSNI